MNKDRHGVERGISMHDHIRMNTHAPHNDTPAFRIVTPDQKCPVCNGPRRVPSGFELQVIDGAVENAYALLANAIEDDPTNVSRIVELAKLHGEQHARRQLVQLEDCDA